MVGFYQDVLMLKGIIKSNGFKIYFWPILVGILLFYLWIYIFFLLTNNLVLEPGSLREAIFVAGCNSVTLSFLWIIALRHQRITGRPIKKIVRISLIILSIAFLVFLIFIPIIHYNL